MEIFAQKMQKNLHISIKSSIFAVELMAWCYQTVIIYYYASNYDSPHGRSC